MWTPADINALPTQSDLTLANQAIKATEEELKDALIALADAQRRVADLEKDLIRRRAWVAPIRRVSLDFLSLIFEFCGEDEWETPLRISEVSRQWRSLVLATPRAWAFLDLRDFRNENHIIGRLLQRSGQHPLHIFLPDHISTSLLCDMEGRLKCLSIMDVDGLSEDTIFQILDRLTIRSERRDMEISYFNDTRFPSLRHLVCNSCFTSSREDSSGALSWSFPPLQTLSLMLTDDVAYTNLLNACSSTLISLKVHFFRRCSFQNPRIILPVFRCMEIRYWHTELGLWSLDLETPVLEVYLEHTHLRINHSPHHKDTAAVKQMRLNHTPTLASFPLLELLQITEPLHFSVILSQLASSNSLSPKLREVELALGTERPTHDLEKELEKVNQHRHVPVKFATMRWLELSYVIPTYPCGVEMPCRNSYF